jgi:hypothetical protein
VADGASGEMGEGDVEIGGSHCCRIMTEEECILNVNVSMQGEGKPPGLSSKACGKYSHSPPTSASYD